MVCEGASYQLQNFRFVASFLEFDVQLNSSPAQLQNLREGGQGITGVLGAKPQALQGVARDRRTVHVRVVVHDEDAVARPADVQFGVIGAEVNREPERFGRVFVLQLACATVGDDLDKSCLWFRESRGVGVCLVSNFDPSEASVTVFAGQDHRRGPILDGDLITDGAGFLTPPSNYLNPWKSKGEVWPNVVDRPPRGFPP